MPELAYGKRPTGHPHQFFMEMCKRDHKPVRHQPRQLRTAGQQPQQLEVRASHRPPEESGENDTASGGEASMQ